LATSKKEKNLDWTVGLNWLNWRSVRGDGPRRMFQVRLTSFSFNSLFSQGNPTQGGAEFCPI